MAFPTFPGMVYPLYEVLEEEGCVGSLTLDRPGWGRACLAATGVRLKYSDQGRAPEDALHNEEQVIARLLSGRAKQIVLTRGADGAEITTDTQHEIIPVCPAQMVDSNGAGDTFSAALWLGQHRGLSLFDAGKFAAAAAAFAVENACLFPREVSIEQVISRAKDL